MTLISTAVLCVLLVEMFVRLPLLNVVSRINKTVLKALRILTAKSVSDHWKEKALLAYAVSLCVSTMRLAGYLASIGVAAVLLILIFDYFGTMVGDFITSWLGFLFSFVMATLYFIVRKFYV